jgi:hypothetical protein
VESLKQFFCLVLLFAAQLTGASSKAQTSPAQAPSPHQDVTIPFEQVNKNIFIQVSVEHSKPHWFVLDTGVKYAVINLTLAKSLGLELGDAVPVGGAGKDTVTGYFLKNSSFALPALEGFSQPLFLALPLDDLAATSGHEFAGVLGYEFIRQFVVEIDYIQKTVTLHEKAGYQYQGHGESLAITFNEAAHPLVRAQLIDSETPIDGTFVVDTGNNSTVILNKPFVDKQRFLQSGRPTVPWLAGRGIGGSTAGAVGRIKGLKLGNLLVADPVVIFSQAEGGAFTSTETQGNIGAAILEKFKVILDYDRNRIILEPNTQFAKPLEYSRSGLLLTTLGDYKTIQVETIAENSPASEAGLKPGDILVAINSRPAAEFTLSQLRQLFSEVPECALSVKRAQKTFQVTLKLRRMI